VKKNCDVLIVGAGTAGCLAAVTAVKLGLNVSLIESKTQDEVGKKICGDAVASHHFDRLGLPYPKGDELDYHIKGVEVYSPDKETCFRIVGKGVSGFIIDRKKFGQRLLNICLDEGVEFHPETVAINPLLDKDYVIGLSVLNKIKKVKEKLYAPLTIDASGVPAVIRRNLSEGFGVER
jgi:flavin-dependent dehydrogenase